MPTLMQKIRLAIRGWNRRREERDREFLKRNAEWGHVTPSVSEGPGGAGGAPPTRPDPSLTLGVTAIDREGLTVAYLDDSGKIEYYLDIETGEVVDVRDRSLTGDRYRRVPTRSAESEMRDRQDFVDSLDPSSAKERLAASIGMPEAFRRALANDRALERAWYNFKNDRAIAIIETWLQQIGLR